MDVLVYLIPISLSLGFLGLAAFVWTLRSRQYDDPDGDGARILRDDFDDAPATQHDPDGRDIDVSGRQVLQRTPARRS